MPEDLTPANEPGAPLPNQVRPGLGMPRLLFGLVVLVALAAAAAVGLIVHENLLPITLTVILSAVVVVAIVRWSQRDLFQFRSEQKRWPRTDELAGWNQEMHGRRAKASRLAAAEKNLKATQRRYADAQAQAGNALSTAEKSHANAMAQASASLEAWQSPGRGNRLASFKSVELYQHAIITKRGVAAILYAQAAVAGNFLTIQCGGAQEIVKLNNNEVPSALQFAFQVGTAACAEFTFQQQRPSAILAAEQYIVQVAADTRAIEVARRAVASTRVDQSLLGAIQAAEQTLNDVQAETTAVAAQPELDAHNESTGVNVASRRPTWQPRASNAGMALIGIVLIAATVGGAGAIATAPASYPASSLASPPPTLAPLPTDASTPADSATPVPAAPPPTVAPATSAPAPVSDTITGFGATDATWEAKHNPSNDSKLTPGCCYNADPNLPQVNGHIGYRYYAVTHIAGRVLNYEIAEYSNTNSTEARAETLKGEFPPDATILWEATKDTCAQMEIQSATLGQALAAPAVGDPQGRVFVEFTTGSGYDPNNITGVILMLGNYPSAGEAPAC